MTKGSLPLAIPMIQLVSIYKKVVIINLILWLFHQLNNLINLFFEFPLDGEEFHFSNDKLNLSTKLELMS
jgi:hypothetical protein